LIFRTKKLSTTQTQNFTTLVFFRWKKNRERERERETMLMRSSSRRVFRMMGMTLILVLLGLCLDAATARLGDQQNDDSSTTQPSRRAKAASGRFSALQPATLMRGASPPAPDMILSPLVCSVDEHCDVAHHEQCVAGSCRCQAGFQRLSSGSSTASSSGRHEHHQQCTKVDNDVLANA